MKKEHFGILNEKVRKIKKDPISRPTPRDVVFEEHGAKLSSGLELIKQSFEKNKGDDSLSDSNLYIFKVELPEEEKVQYKSELFSKNGMTVNAVKNERNAIVSTTKQQFQILKNRIDAYTQNGKGKTYFDYIDELKPYVGRKKF